MKNTILSILARIQIFRRLGRAVFPDSLLYTISSLNKNQSRLERLESPDYQHLPIDFGAKRSSDTVFILGSGSSVSDMTDEDFKLISKHDSIGFNLWIAHSFVPNFYVFQNQPPTYQNVLEKLLELKAGNYAETEILIRGDSLPEDDSDLERFFELGFGRRPIWHLAEFPIHSELDVEISELIKFLKSLDLWGSEKLSNKIPKFAGTAGLVISLCYQMGYKNIVLCGVDMNDSPHFYNTNYYKNLFPDLDLPPVGAARRIKSGVFDAQREWIVDLSKALSEEGVTVSLYGNKSSLSKFLPIWRRQTMKRN